MDRREQKRAAQEAEYKRLASRWRERLDQEIKAFQDSGDRSPDKLVDIYWEYYVLGRLAPEDSLEKEAREAKGKDVWSGDRDDPELYVRILTSLYYAQDAVNKQITMEGGGWGSGAVMEVTLKAPHLLRGIPATKQPEDWASLFIERTESSITSFGGEVPIKRLRSGLVGIYKGMEVRIDRLTDDGRVLLEPADSNFDTREQLLSVFAEDHPGEGIVRLSISELDLDSFE